ncbi:MAG TPA: hypothetical protein VHX11_08975 [Acidobacteriaceae bacterium]|jgi:hypothetical protein|nr:hypothetical protein [Acidobacteriaceae bacterium]
MNLTLHLHIPGAALWFAGGIVVGATALYFVINAFIARAVGGMFGW